MTTTYETAFAIARTELELRRRRADLFAGLGALPAALPPRPFRRRVVPLLAEVAVGRWAAGR